VEQDHTVIGNKLRAFAEKSIVVADADVLEHADRDDAVEGPLNGAIVFEAEIRDPVQALFLGARARQRELFLRERHAFDMGAAHLGEVEAEPAPA